MSRIFKTLVILFAGILIAAAGLLFSVHSNYTKEITLKKPQQELPKFELVNLTKVLYVIFNN